ncbi:MAG: helix-turn-helix domain-containing protein [Turicibacter sp.]|nr:helix-turn-helix domain-containing protein [Turicibacter sp.]
MALDRDRILDAVWGIDYFGDTRVVDTHIKKIRKKLGVYSKYIHTVFGVGYKFEVI